MCPKNISKSRICFSKANNIVLYLSSFRTNTSQTSALWTSAHYLVEKLLKKLFCLIPEKLNSVLFILKRNLLDFLSGLRQQCLKCIVLLKLIGDLFVFNYLLSVCVCVCGDIGGYWEWRNHSNWLDHSDKLSLSWWEVP